MAMIKRLFVVILIISMLLSGCSSNTAAEGETVDVENAVAVVNDEAIDVSTFNIFYNMYAQAYMQQYGDDVLEREYEGTTFDQILKEDILEMLVQDSLLRAYVLSTGFEIDQDEVASNLEELNSTLAEDPDTQAMYDAIGVDEAFLEEQIQSSLLMNEFSNIISNEIDADEEKLNDLYENYAVQVSASHILVDDDLTATLVEEKIAAGEDFAALAEEYSQDPGSASAGGSLGYFGRGVMVSEFEDAAFSLGIGEVSDPIQSSYGYHIIKVDDIKTINSMIADGEEEDVVDVYKQQIKDDLFDEYYLAKIDELKAAATIEQYPEKVADTTPVDLTTTSEEESDATSTESTDSSTESTTDDNASTDDLEDSAEDNQ